MSNPKVDVHAHLLSPTYRKTLLDHGYTLPDGMPGIPEWSMESHLAYMDSNGIAKSILSVSAPGLCITPDEDLNIKLTRECNDYAANVKAQYPDRFGYFASLPLPNIAASILELKRVLDGPSKADGIALFSNNRGIYLGDPVLRPVLLELNARNAIVFVHPIAPSCEASRDCHTPTAAYFKSSPLASVYRAPIFEYFFDSARSVSDLIMSGTACRFEKIRWIISHCGGVLPSLIDRIFLFMRFGQPLATNRDSIPVTEQQIREVLERQFWFDLAGNPIPNLIHGLLKFTGKERLLFGSDVPWTPFHVAGGSITHMEEDLPRCVGEDSLRMIYSGNAAKLLSLEKDA